MREQTQPALHLKLDNLNYLFSLKDYRHYHIELRDIE